MENTTNLKLPLLIPNQSQKEITHNEALVIIDNLLNNGVIDKDLVTPPATPTQNALYIVASGATGLWEGQDKNLAYYDNGWKFNKALVGTIYWVIDENCLYVFNGTNWLAYTSTSGGSTSGITNFSQLQDVVLSSLANGDIIKYNGTTFINSKELQNITKIGINTDADNDNKLSVKSDYILFDKATNNSKVKVNKASLTDTASHLFQDNYSGRAEFGLIGNNDFTLKVSNNGEAWKNAFVVDKETGNIDFKGEITKNGSSLGSGSSDIILKEETIIEDNTAIIEFTNLDINKKHIFEFYNVNPNAINSANLYCQLSSNGTYITNYNYSSIYANVNNGGAYFGSAGISAIPLNVIGNSGFFINNGVSGKIDFFNQSITGRQYLNYESSSEITGNNVFSNFGKLSCGLLGNAFDKMKFYLSSGTFKSGIIKHYIIN